MDLSNRSLAVLLVVAIVVSLGSTIVSLNRLTEMGFTGMAPTDTGSANLTINSSVSCRFLINNSDYGAGFANNTGGGIDYCLMDTNGTANASDDADCAGFNDPVSHMVIENFGNLDVTLNLSSDSDNSTLIGGTAPGFNWSFENNESGSCSSGLTPTGWTAVVTVGNTSVCASTNFQFAESTNTINLNTQLNIPEDATPGSRQAIFTAYCFNP